ncbi:MAG TPA: Trk system potassium transporter TrkA [Fastidiosipila sp.]|nr:Trk system potassium transporter TrkA [Fastidiosipila sp.]
MRIVIIGAGKVGEELCRSLAIAGHDITLIEKDADRLEQLVNMTDIKGIVGNGSIYETQLEAGVDTCDIFIAVSPFDEINIIAAITAKQVGATHTIARVRDPDYSRQANFVKESLGITMMINPEMEAALDISRIIQFPSALGIERFGGGLVNIIEVVINNDSPLAGQHVKDFREKHMDVLICVISRNGDVIIPSGQTVIQAGDHIHVTGTSKELTKFYKAAGFYRQPLKSVFIVGAHRIAYYLIQRILPLKMRVKTIELDPEVAEAMAADFPEVEVVAGDGTDQQVLKEERMSHYDAVIALTGVDEENLLLSLYAKSEGVKKTVTKVNRTNLVKLLEAQPLDSIITPRRLIADIIIRFVRAMQNSEGSNVDALYRIADNKVEALQFTVRSDCKIAGIPLINLTLKNHVLIAAIMRNGHLIFPRGTDKIQTGDRVIVVTTHINFNDLDDVLADGQDFLEG